MLNDRERAALIWEKTPYTQPPLRAPKIRAPKGCGSVLLIALLFPVAVPLMVLGSVTHTAITKRTNKY